MDTVNEILISVQTQHNSVRKLRLKIQYKAERIIKRFTNEKIITSTEGYEIVKRAECHFVKQFSAETNAIQAYILQFIVQKLSTKVKKIKRRNQKLIRLIRA